jgi:multiple sugar transport system substrate-binding protein
MTGKFYLSRRQFVGAALAAIAVPIIQACTPVTTPVPGAAPEATEPPVDTTPPAAGETAPPPEAGPTALPETGQETAPLPYTSQTDVSGQLEFWHFWGSPLRRNAIRRVIAGFNEHYPEIQITETFVPFGDIWTRAIAAVAAGSGMPDVLVDTVQLFDRAQNNIMTNLQELADRDNITEADFWPHAWAQANVEGNLYGLPYETDIRVLYYNKAQFADAGLDPETPPADWDALWTAADALDSIAENGSIERMGFHPLIGNIGLDQWAWCNGGEWQLEDGTPTINAPENVETLAWIQQWSDRYGKENVDAFQGTFGPPGLQDRFMSGKMSSLVDIQGYTSFLNFFNPNLSTEEGENLGYGLGAIPPAPGHEPVALSGGFALTNPRGSQQTEAMWEFAKYAVYVGQASWARDTYAVPTVQELARNDAVLNADPRWSFFIEAMDYGRPGVFNPFYPNMLEVLGPAVDAVLSGAMTPQEALGDAQRRAEEEIARARG